MKREYVVPTGGQNRVPSLIPNRTNPDLDLLYIGNYLFEKTLGKGTYGKVRLGKHVYTGQSVAVKIIDKTRVEPRLRYKFYKEAAILKTMHHPNIIRVIEIIETPYTLYLVLECMKGGELHERIVNSGKIPEKEARALFRKIVSAVTYCHKKNVVHRDLKTQNILVDESGEIKIADFGLSNNFDYGGTLDTICGSPPYAAPELFNMQKYTGPEVDMWSLGVILYLMTTGKLPFDGKRVPELNEDPVKGHFAPPINISKNLQALIRKLLNKNPKRRASTEILRNDPWLMEGYTTSPLEVDLGAKFPIEEELISKIVEKFNVEKIDLLQAIEEEKYNEVSALYYLAYLEVHCPVIPGKKVKPSLTSTATAANGAKKGKRIEINRMKKISCEEDEIGVFVANYQYGYYSGQPRAAAHANARHGNEYGQNKTGQRRYEPSPLLRPPVVLPVVKKPQLIEPNTPHSHEAVAMAAAIEAKVVKEIKDANRRRIISQQRHPDMKRLAAGEAYAAEKIRIAEEAAKAAQNAAKEAGLELGPLELPVKIIPGTGVAIFSRATAKLVAHLKAQRKAKAEKTRDKTEKRGWIVRRKNAKNDQPVGAPTVASPPASPVVGQSAALSVTGTSIVCSPATAAKADNNNEEMKSKGKSRARALREYFRNFRSTPRSAGHKSSSRPKSPKGQASPAGAAADLKKSKTNPKEEPPRSLWYKFQCETRSSLEPEKIMERVLDSCDRIRIKTKKKSNYVVSCVYSSERHGEVNFEVEVCKLPRLKNDHGLSFKRLSGDTEVYKTIYNGLIAMANLEGTSKHTRR